MNKISLLFTLCVICGFVSCGGGDKPVDPPIPPVPEVVIDLAKPVLDLNFSGTGSATASFTASTSWLITLSDTKAVPTWFTVDKMSGAAGSHTLTLTVIQANPSTTASRNGYIVITSGQIKATMTIVQPRSEATTVAVAGVALDKPTLSLIVGDSEKLIATILPENATNKNMTWESSDDAIATVSASGEVTAIAEGSVKITVATVDGAKTATCEVNVLADDMISLDVIQKIIESSAGEFSVQLTANKQWSATGVPKWVTLDPESGNGNANVKVKYNQNSSEDQRVASIVFTAGNATKTLAITQKVNQLNDLEPEEL